jgi:single-stranded-DNA-specific exonuclease
MLGEVDTQSNLEIDGWLGLNEVTLDLAAVLESLAPYGPGNEKLTLATRGLKLQSKTPIGRNKEHLKLNVIDDAGNGQTVLWWNGAGEGLPEGRFDLAYTVRASDWRGTRQVQMEFVDFRLTEEKPLEAKTRKLEVVDYRNIKDPLSMLATLQVQPSTIIWVEGDEKKTIGGKDRNELEPAENLVVWTTPPSPEELHAALDKVHSQTVTLFATTEPVETPEDFLSHLAGLLKYAINHRKGKVTWSELAGATAQRTATIRNGLDWLVSQGGININTETGDEMVVSIGTSLKDPAGASRIWVEIQSSLAETAAYRAHFKHADKDTLLH